MSHPSDESIRTWLEVGHPSEVGEHIGTCDRCSEAAEELTAGALSIQIRSFVAAPSDYEDRILRRVDAAVGRTKALEVWAGLFTIGLRTVDILIGDPSDEHR